MNAKPFAKSVRLPVIVVPPSSSVTPDPCDSVIDDVLVFCTATHWPAFILGTVVFDERWWIWPATSVADVLVAAVPALTATGTSTRVIVSPLRMIAKTGGLLQEPLDARAPICSWSFSVRIAQIWDAPVFTISNTRAPATPDSVTVPENVDAANVAAPPTASVPLMSALPPTVTLLLNVLLPPIVLGSLSDGTVPELRLLALRLVSPEPFPVIVPLTVTLLLNVAAPPT